MESLSTCGLYVERIVRAFCSRLGRVHFHSFWLVCLWCYRMAGPEPTPVGDRDVGKPKLDVTDLAQKLDAQEEIRNHLRQDDSPDLFHEETNDCVKDAIKPHIHAVLKVLLEITVSTQGMPQPPIHPLREQLQLLYQKCGRNPEEKTIIQDSWFVRKFLTFVKMKTRKGKVSTDLRL